MGDGVKARSWGAAWGWSSSSRAGSGEWSVELWSDLLFGLDAGVKQRRKLHLVPRLPPGLQARDLLLVHILQTRL